MSIPFRQYRWNSHHPIAVLSLSSKRDHRRPSCGLLLLWFPLRSREFKPFRGPAVLRTAHAGNQVQRLRIKTPLAQHFFF